MQYRGSLVIQAALWVLIVILALVMQVIPLLLILTLFNMAVGISSTAMLIAIPTALFGSLLLACAYAERRRRAWRPSPVRVDEVRHQQLTLDKASRGRAAAHLLEFRRRWFY